MPSASGPAMRSATPGSGRPAVSGWIAASSVGDAVTPEPASDRPYVGTTGQPAAMARRTRPGAIAPPPRGTARSVGGGRTSPPRSSRRVRTVVTSETWLGWGAAPNAARMAAGSGRASTTNGTPDRAARQTTPNPATCARPTARSQPVASGSAASHASALATSAAVDRTTAFGRPVVPEVRTMTAGAAGSGDGSGGGASVSGVSDRGDGPVRSSSDRNGPPSARAEPSSDGSWMTRSGAITSPATASSSAVRPGPSGAATPPTRAIAWSVATAAADGAVNIATRDPGRTPACSSSRAIASARASSSCHVQAIEPSTIADPGRASAAASRADTARLG